MLSIPIRKVHEIKHPTLTKENWGEEQPLVRVNFLGKELDIIKQRLKFLRSKMGGDNNGK